MPQSQSEVELDKLKKKILALLAKAERTDNAHEAAAFGGKARALMEEHQLTMANLQQAKDELGRTAIVLKYGDACWVHLAATAATYLGCHALLTSAWQDGKKKRAIIFVGRASSRAVAEIMYPFWYNCCVRGGRKLHRERGRDDHARQSIAEVAMAFGWRLQRLTPIIAHQALAEAEAWENAESGGHGHHKGFRAPSVGRDAKQLADSLPVDMQLA